ncbi:MAG: hypothetical protein AAF430_07055 [Myxococcota bacterium]
MTLRLAVSILFFACLACAPAVAEDAKPAAPKLSMGDGEHNRIVTDGLARDGRVLTFREVVVADNSWLVLHPFKDGKPVGAIYVGATYLAAGTHENVEITVQTAPEPEPGVMYLVMLHQDVNNDETFDFVFVDERNVLDKAVFEGTTMIAHAVAAP